MLCYRDMTFCPFHESCASAPECPRALTEAIQREASRLQAPVCLYAAKPSCYLASPTTRVAT